MGFGVMEEMKLGNVGNAICGWVVIVFELSVIKIGIMHWAYRGNSAIP
jgi:hypothetical protein